MKCPLDSKLVFSIKAVTPETFTPEQKIEVATADGSFHTTLMPGPMAA